MEPKFRKRKSGVTRIVRADYGPKGEWFKLTAEIKKRDGGKCIFCGKPEQPKLGVYHQVHHITSLGRGGTNSKANLGTTCKACHEKRPGHKHMQEAPKARPVYAAANFNAVRSTSATPASKFSQWRK